MQGKLDSHFVFPFLVRFELIYCSYGALRLSVYFGEETYAESA